MTDDRSTSTFATEPLSYSGPVIDACIHHTWSSQLELMEYMSSGWREFLGRPNLLPDGSGLITITAGNPYRRPGGEKRPDSVPGSGRAEGSDYEMLKSQVLSANDVRQVVLSFDTGGMSPALGNPHMTAEIARAANDWTIERWLGLGDDRLSSLMLVANQMPDVAAAEILRVGKHPKIVGVLMGANGLGKGFGHPVYHPIYKAAADLALPIVIRTGTEVAPDVSTNSVAGGAPATYAEYRILGAQALMTHVASLIGQGVFEKFPDLRVLVQGAGAIWIPTLIWHFDTDYRALRREVPWVRRMPSEYFCDHVRVGTNPFDKAPSHEKLLKAYSAIERLDEILCFASGYPNWDSDTAASVASQLPEGWRAKVMHDNAATLFRRGTGSGVGEQRTPVRVGQL